MKDSSSMRSGEQTAASLNIFICGGGTGGHFFSGLALGETILNLEADSKIIFIGTKWGIEARTPLPDPRMSLEFISSKGLLGKGMIAKLKGLFAIALGIFQSFFLIMKFRPDWVVGVGGYASAPTVFSALLLRPFFKSKVLVLEQNSFAGQANQWLRRLGAKGFSGFPISHFELVDLPLRKIFYNALKSKRNSVWPPQSILVMGGSQGAHGLNQKWMSIVEPLKAAYPHIKIFHQTGKADEELCKKFYGEKSIEAEVFPFSAEMPKYYNEADLLICRSGAMTIFEVMAFQRPAVFIPFPAAAQDHQRINAESVQRREWIIDEKNFSWASISPILRESEASFLSRRGPKPLRTWTQILDLRKK